MRVRNKIAYGIVGALGFIPLFILVIIQSIFALEATYDSKLVLDPEEMTVTGLVLYDNYNNDITHLIDSRDEDNKPILFSIIEAKNDYLLIDFHGGKINDQVVEISGLQFTNPTSKSELVHGVVYLQFENVTNSNVWLSSYIDYHIDLYEEFYEQPAGTISHIWFKIITASLGTIVGLVTVLLVFLRKSTKALVKRYWRISVLIGFINTTIILGLITWLIADIFQVFAAATIGWMIFLGAEKLAKVLGYIETAASTGDLVDDLPPEAKADIETTIQSVLAKYKR